MSETLVDICKKYNLGHMEGGTDKESYHKYCSTFYDKEFIHYKDKPIKIFEIGVLKFGSLLLWNYYFTNPETLIYGTDLYDYGCFEKIKDLNRIKFIMGNAYDNDFVNSLPEFDIIIDDGPHTKETQMQFLRLYLPKLKKDGLLIIEDVCYFNLITEYTNILPDPYFPVIVDARKVSGIKDSLLFIVRK
jgi:hypothetical protein